MTEDSSGSRDALKHTPLFELHRRMGAKMTSFAGYEMPVSYRKGVLEEHRFTRRSAGLFDVSHMGQFEIRPSAGSIGEVAAALETLSPADFVGLRPGKQLYGVFTNEKGGIVDDFIAGRLGERYRIVANASRRAEVEFLLAGALAEADAVELRENYAMLALQGPLSAAALDRLVPGVRGMGYMDACEFNVGGIELVVSRSGYTGEDGFEISFDKAHADGFASELLEMDEVEPIGLAARDSLRMEAGFCLYGNDIDEATTPVEAGLSWTIGKARRQGGGRAGNYPGFGRIDEELRNGAGRRRVGLIASGRVPLRSGTPLYDDADGLNYAGVVTSGGFGPSVGAPISICYLDAEFARAAATVYGEVRGKLHPARVSAMPFEFKRLST